ncbi:hypothetical protein TM1040_3056 (plasmid) [Ruegeria sp. TM1040]|nr:hypothetical protein TM1040_3056 [Ruegeria sp. TM1040]
MKSTPEHSLNIDLTPFEMIGGFAIYTANRPARLRRLWRRNRLSNALVRGFASFTEGREPPFTFAPFTLGQAPAMGWAAPI